MTAASCKSSSKSMCFPRPQLLNRNFSTASVADCEACGATCGWSMGTCSSAAKDLLYLRHLSSKDITKQHAGEVQQSKHVHKIHHDTSISVDISTVIQIIRKSGKRPRTSGKWISTPTIIVVHHGSCRITVYRIPFKNSTAEAQNIQRKTTGSRTIIFHICETSGFAWFCCKTIS